MNEVIKHLSDLIDIEIHREMVEFTSLGRIAKKMALEEKPIDEIEKIHQRMFHIFRELYICESRLRDLYPSLADMFNLFSRVPR